MEVPLQAQAHLTVGTNRLCKSMQSVGPLVCNALKVVAGPCSIPNANWKGATSRSEADPGRKLQAIPLLKVNSPQHPVWPTRLVHKWKAAAVGKLHLWLFTSGNIMCGKTSEAETFSLQSPTKEESVPFARYLHELPNPIP